MGYAAKREVQKLAKAGGTPRRGTSHIARAVVCFLFIVARQRAARCHRYAAAPAEIKCPEMPIGCGLW